MIWLAVAGVFLRRLWAALRACLVPPAARGALVESNRLLEESALEAVASLNATVDAKDPYTAGHSQRVQRIAVAIGRELGLGGDRLERSASPGSSTTSARSACPTRSSRSRSG